MERILKINGKPKIFDISQTCAHFSAQQHSRLQKPTSKNWLLISWSHHLYIIEDLRWPLNLELNTPDTNFLCHLILLCGKISRDIILSPLASLRFYSVDHRSHHITSHFMSGVLGSESCTLPPCARTAPGEYTGDVAALTRPRVDHHRSLPRPDVDWCP